MSDSSYRNMRQNKDAKLEVLYSQGCPAIYANAMLIVGLIEWLEWAPILLSICKLNMKSGTTSKKYLSVKIISKLNDYRWLALKTLMGIRLFYKSYERT
jgi:hypothetical protein